MWSLQILHHQESFLYKRRLPPQWREACVSEGTSMHVLTVNMSLFFLCLQKSVFQTSICLLRCHFGLRHRLAKQQLFFVGNGTAALLVVTLPHAV